MTSRKPKPLSAFTYEQIVRSIIVRTREGEPPKAIRGRDLAGNRTLLEGFIAENRADDRFYLMDEPDPSKLVMSLPPLFHHHNDPPALFRYGIDWAASVPPPKVPAFIEPVDTPEALEAQLAAIVNDIRDQHLIELDDIKHPIGDLTPLDDAADRFRLMDLEPLVKP